MDKLFLQILNMSITSTYVILFVILIRFLLRKTPKIYSYSLWSVVLLRFIFPFSFESIFSFIRINPKAIPIDIIYTQIPQINSGIGLIDNVVNNTLPAATLYASANSIQIWILIGEIIWLVGMVTLIIYSIITTIKLSKRLKHSINISRNIYKVDYISTPFVFGLIKPKIYLPVGLSENEKSYIIKHEQTHIERYDHIIKFITFVVLSIHWFNPLVWLAFILMSKDMELSCDEKVIRELGNEIKKDYSNSLLSLSLGRKIIGGSPLAFAENNTKGRIKNILNYKKPKFYIIFITFIILIIAFVGLMTNPVKDSKYYAEQFLEIVTTPEDLESTKYVRDVFYSGATSQYSIEEYGESLIKDYGYLMTDRAFDNAVSNRFIPWAELIRQDTNYNIKVDSLDVKEAKTYEDGRVHYIYLLSLRVSFVNGVDEAVSVSGDIVMIEENGVWLVDVFKWNSDYQDLNKLLFPTP